MMWYNSISNMKVFSCSTVSTFKVNFISNGLEYLLRMRACWPNKWKGPSYQRTVNTQKREKILHQMKNGSRSIITIQTNNAPNR